MMVWPVGLILTAAVTLGIVLGLNYLRGIRKPIMNGVHLLLGLGALESLAVLVNGPPNGLTMHARPLAMAALGLFALSVLSGLIRPLMRRQMPRAAEILLVTHAGVGLLGFLLFLVWASRI
jgi:hypothetical protein